MANKYKTNRFKEILPVIFLKFVLVLFLIEQLLTKLPSINIRNYSIYPLDIISSLMLILVLMKLLNRKLLIENKLYIILLFGFLVFFSLLRGIQTYGFEQSVGSFRPYLYFYSVLLFTVTMVNDGQKILSTLSFWTDVGWALFIITIYRWILVFSGLNTTVGGMSAGGLPMRVISASATQFLLQALIFIIFISNIRRANYLNKLAPLLFIPTIILLQHRTLWVIMIFIFPIILFTWKGLKSKRAFIFSIMIILLSLVIFSLIFLADNPFVEALGLTAVNIDNFIWRLDSWRLLLAPERYSNPLGFFIGRPFGSSFSRLLPSSSGQLIERTESAHNFYVQTLINIGVIGLVLLLIIYYKTIRKILTQKKSNIYFAFVIILISQILFFMTYTPSYEQGILLGFAILMCDKGKKD